MTSKSEQNIFTAPKRTHNDAIKFPPRLPGGDEQQIEKSIISQHETNNENFLKLMEKHYAIFNYKINKCKLSCAEKSNGYGEIKNCYSGCENGVKTFRRFVDERITEMQRLMGECVSTASGLPNSLYETYRCYDLYNKGFAHLRSVIKEESLYYQ